MKRLLSSLCLTSCLLATSFPISLLPTRHAPHLQSAQAQTAPDLFYTFYGQRIPLSLRQDTIAVTFKPVSTRGGNTPLYLQLQQDLEGRRNTRGTSSEKPLQVKVNPLGERYALITIPAGVNGNEVSQRIEQRDYVENTLPVLSRQVKTNGQSEPRNETIVLPNEIVISFEPGLSNSQKQMVLNSNSLEVIRPLRFSQNRYLVRSRTLSGTAILNVANQLNQVSGIQSATPNFVQSLSYTLPQAASAGNLADKPNAVEQLQKLLGGLPIAQNSPFQTAMLPLSWHLDSTARRGKFLPRTDVRATDAWQHSDRGKGAVVAVIDSLIQWDHPDLANNLYSVPDSASKLPGEIHGWDFANNDADTRISDPEITILRPHFQATFQLSTAELLKNYDQLAQAIKENYPNASTGQIAIILRNYVRSEIAAEFHGTWSSGVIAARPNNQNGVVGVAPEAKILPVRVFGLGGEITSASLIEAIGYAADRKVDVINMSLGGLLPDRELTDQIFSVLDANPKLVIVASAGNESLDGVAFPAAIPGVVSVGATNFTGNRAYYSSFGGRLDLVAPGGETVRASSLGILTTGGTWVDGFWEGIQVPEYAWGMALDPKGEYVQVQGTSFSAPTVAGVLALMKGEDRDRRLSREQLVSILKKTSSYEGLNLSKADVNQYRLQASIGFGTIETFPFLRPSGIFPQPRPVSAEQYFFGSGLVNADAAVLAVKR
ncbi:MAG: S8 family serine peptidase [Leptolyngbyaceae cyanobacterium CSU_1_3]|nr:S8 family serine peptidase [Leptolyngbyaceae cyanobacterium CSU_1_3]